MKPIRQHVLRAMACAALLICGAAWGASRAPQQDQPDVSAEDSAFQAAHDGKRAQDKIKLLDDFAAAYPDSSLLRDAYRDEYMTYFSLGNYPETANYADKFLAYAEKNDSTDRLEALITRAEAFLAGCVDAVFRTPQSYTAARAAATQGLEALAQLPSPPDCLRLGPCRAERERVQSLFNSAGAIAELGLKDANPESCKGPGSPAIFDHVIDNIRQRERESPNVR
jgi:hypothetical protein